MVVKYQGIQKTQNSYWPFPQILLYWDVIPEKISGAGTVDFHIERLLLVPGTYEIHYVEETAGVGVPGNQDAVIGSVEVAAPIHSVRMIHFDSDGSSTPVSGA